MNYTTLTTLASGLLQCAVVGYGFWLTRRFGVARVGWPLAFTFSLLALLRAFLCQTSFEFGVKVDIMFGVISLLILAGMVQLQVLLRERQRVESARRQTQLELETSVQEKTAELTRVNDELQQTTKHLMDEVAERSRMQLQAEKNHKEMLIVSRQAGMSDVATSVLHNVGNVLNSLNVSASIVASHLEELKINRLIQIARLINQHSTDLGDFFANNPKGRQVPHFLTHLGEHLFKEQTLLLKEIDFVKTKVEHIKVIVATQQNYGKVSGVTENVRVTDLVEDLLRIHVPELEEHGIKIQREYEPNLPEIPVDKHKVLQILLNLTANAKHSCVDTGREERQVTVRVSNGDDRVRIAVSDNGVGISQENIKRVFNYGFTTRKKTGHGFGLHSGALIAKELGGALTVQSDGPGQGAIFTLELPLKTKTPALWKLNP
jgi:C4-dicarboxylate-specific signal transduction histidine kinase